MKNLKLDAQTNQDAMLVDLLSAHMEDCEQRGDSPELREEIENCQILLGRLNAMLSL